MCLETIYRCDSCCGDIPCQCEECYPVDVHLFMGIPEGYKLISGDTEEYEPFILESPNGDRYEVKRDRSGWGDDCRKI